MYLSKYNIIVKDFCGRFIFYNSISKNIVKARSIETENKIVKILSGLPCQNCGELINKLKEDGFILPFLYDEKILLENQIQVKMFTDKTLRLTIIPTDSCNFACKYCYQTSRDTVITEEIVSELKRFLEKNIYQYNSLHIDWFGGEPLLCKDKVLNIMEYCYSLSKQKKVSLYSRITTNGFLLDPQIFRSLYKYHVLEYQITIDGIEELHNCQRPLKNGKETYGTIINNLKEISKVSGHFHIIYRVNISKKSLALKQSIMDEFMKNFGNDKRFILDIEPIRDWGGDRIADFSDELLENVLYEEEMPNTRLLKNQNTAGCGAVNKNSFTINCDGKIYKCAMQIYHRHKTTDKINQVAKFINGDLIINSKYNAMWLGQSKQEKCNECKIYPICQALLCPVQRFYEESIINYSCKDMQEKIISSLKNYERYSEDFKYYD